MREVVAVATEKDEVLVIVGATLRTVHNMVNVGACQSADATQSVVTLDDSFSIDFA